MVIDVHAHCIPDGFRSWLAENGDRVGASVVASPAGDCVQFTHGHRTGPQYSWTSLSNRTSRIEAMDRMGVDIQILAGWIDLSGYEVRTEHALEYAHAHNESLAEEAASNPDRFRSIGTAPLQNPDIAIAALSHAMDELGMVGLQIATRIGSQALDTNHDLDEFWAAAADQQALLVLHPLRPLDGVDLDRFFLDNTVGRPAESSIVLSGLIMSGVFERHPTLQMCVVHGGGFVPYQIGRLDRAHERVPGLAATQTTRPPSSFLDQVYIDTIVHDPVALRYAIERMGADRVLLGTDYPFPMGDDDPVGLIGAIADLPEAGKRAILTENAAQWIR